MRNQDLQYPNVVSLRSMNSDTVHTNELVIEEYDQWTDTAISDMIAFSGACGFDGESWEQAA